MKAPIFIIMIFVLALVIVGCAKETQTTGAIYIANTTSTDTTTVLNVANISASDAGVFPSLYFTTGSGSVLGLNNASIEYATVQYETTTENLTVNNTGVIPNLYFTNGYGSTLGLNNISVEIVQINPGNRTSTTNGSLWVYQNGSILGLCWYNSTDVVAISGACTG